MRAAREVVLLLFVIEEEQTIEVDCNGKLVLIRVHEVEVVHAHDIVCQCETEDAFGENIDQVEEGREVSQDAPAESDAARIFSGQLVMKATDRDRQDSLPEERGVMVWGEETTLAVSREELAPVVAAAVEERGTKVVFEAELDSTLNRDRNTISNSIFVGDENLTIVPIEVTDSIPDHHAVPQTSPSEVMVLGGVTRKVRSVNDLIINIVPGNQRITLLRAQNRKKGWKIGIAVQRGSSFANESLFDSDF
ncbi:hypothetical protein V6N13_113960 [Hibiscus sabdariffa]